MMRGRCSFCKTVAVLVETEGGNKICKDCIEQGGFKMVHKEDGKKLLLMNNKIVSKQPTETIKKISKTAYTKHKVRDWEAEILEFVKNAKEPISRSAFSKARGGDNYKVRDAFGSLVKKRKIVGEWFNPPIGKSHNRYVLVENRKKFKKEFVDETLKVIKEEKPVKTDVNDLFEEDESAKKAVREKDSVTTAKPEKKIQSKERIHILDDWKEIRIKANRFDDRRIVAGILADNGYMVTIESVRVPPPPESPFKKWESYVVVTKKEVGKR